MTAPNEAKPNLARAVVFLRERSGDQERSDRQLSHFWRGVRSARPWLGGRQGEPVGLARSTKRQR
jgi:hypothetical protein